MCLRIAISITLISVSSSFAQSRVEVTIAKVDHKKGGTVRIALFDNSESFLKKPLKAMEVKVNGPETTLYFDLPMDGEFAISVYQDTNDNKELDTNFMGIPNEPYGFSNDAMGTFGPPSFEKAKFKVEGKAKAVINLK